MIVFPELQNQSNLLLLVQDAPMAPVAGPLFEAKVHLYTNDLDPDVNTVLGDFVEATFDGSDAQTIDTWDAPFLLPSGNSQTVGSPVSFVCSGDAAFEIVNGVYVTNDTGDTLLYSEKFESSVSINQVGAGLVYIPSVEVGQG